MKTFVLSLAITSFIFAVNLTLYTASAKGSQKVVSYINNEAGFLLRNRDIKVVKTLKAIPEEVRDNASASSVKKLLLKK